MHTSRPPSAGDCADATERTVSGMRMLALDAIALV